MANSFKTLLPEDVASTRTLLHEAIPITGTIVSGTYNDENVKYFAHGMYEAVYDYPFLSSSANHIFDITAGYASGSDFGFKGAASDADPGEVLTSVQDQKKRNVYNQFAQVLVGYDVNGKIQKFTPSGAATEATKMDSCFFINFARLLGKDEIKKDSFRFNFFSNCGDLQAGGQAGERAGGITLGDYNAQTTYLTDSPAGEYGLIRTSSNPPSDITNPTLGHIYYQAGVVVLTSSIVSGFTPTNTTASVASTINTGSVLHLFRSGTIDEIGNHIRYAYDDVDFNNTTELNSTIYFCRANNTEFNYSANPTYLASSEIVVKGNNPLADPVSYVTTVGLYSPDNELLAVAKLSEPLKKTPSSELTLRVRLDY